jgi:hypothetical protein
MKKTLLAVAFGLSVSTSAFAAIMNPMYINLSDNTYDAAGGSFTDPNTTTGNFTQFTFGQLLATSVYDMSDGSLAGSFYDTNITSELSAIASIPSPALPSAGQIMLDGLKPLAPPLSSDNEGFLNSWELTVQYHFDGTLSLTTGPTYTGGYFDIYFHDLLNNTSTKVLGGTLTGSSLQAANLNLFFDINYATDNFLFIKSPTGQFIDAATLAGNYNPYELILDTNVDPPIPSASQMTGGLDFNNNGNPVAWRQTTLDGSISANIPEPGTLALAGLGLLGLGLSRRRKQAV